MHRNAKQSPELVLLCNACEKILLKAARTRSLWWKGWIRFAIKGSLTGTKINLISPQRDDGCTHCKFFARVEQESPTFPGTLQSKLFAANQFSNFPDRTVIYLMTVLRTDEITGSLHRYLHCQYLRATCDEKFVRWDRP
jgi:hypothetical protein